MKFLTSSGCSRNIYSVENSHYVHEAGALNEQASRFHRRMYSFVINYAVLTECIERRMQEEGCGSASNAYLTRSKAVKSFSLGIFGNIKILKRQREGLIVNK